MQGVVRAVAAGARGQLRLAVAGGDLESAGATLEIAADYFYLGEEKKTATRALFIEGGVTSAMGAV
eukprot:7589335-Pyramimonas_sp.AAC.1